MDYKQELIDIFRNLTSPYSPAQPPATGDAVRSQAPSAPRALPFNQELWDDWHGQILYDLLGDAALSDDDHAEGDLWDDENGEVIFP